MICAIIGLALAASGCVAPRDPLIIDTGCYTFRPIYLEAGDADAVSDSLAIQLQQHNTAGRRICGWKPLGEE